MERLPYDEMLRSLVVLSLENRRVRGKMIEVYKIMRIMEIADREKFSTLSHNSGIQGYLVKLKVGKFRTDKIKCFCSHSTQLNCEIP